jgi:hypothetical protein
MSESIKAEAQTVDPKQMIEQCKSVLKAGGTVYLGERHTEADGRNVCKKVLAARCVQYFCIEFNGSGSAGQPKERFLGFINSQENETKHENQGRTYAVPMKDVLTIALDDPGCEVVCIDQTHITVRDPNGPLRGVRQVNNSGNRQNYMKEKVKACRSKITMVGRGVLVLVGSDHLDSVRDKDIWDALQKIVYDGHSFVYGKYNNCYMVWQLS